MQTTKVQISLRICKVWSAPLFFAALIVWYLFFLNSKFQDSSLVFVAEHVAEQAGLSHTWSQTPKTGFLVMWLIIKLGKTLFITEKSGFVVW